MADHRSSPTPGPTPLLRERLLLAATEIAGASGREAVTVERLATRADASVTEVLELFPDSRSCLLAAYEAWIERGLRAIERPSAGEASARADSPIEALLTARLTALFVCLVERPAVARLCLVEVPSAGHAGQIARDETLNRYRRSLQRQLEPLGVGPRTERVGEMAAGAIYDVAQRAAHDEAIEQLPALVGPLIRTWAPAFGDQT
ncbi:MAG TPA: hypothetical protein VI111_01195 [Thermoleophilaceae bacterium]